MGKPGAEPTFLGFGFICSPLLSMQGSGLTAVQYMAEGAKLSVGSGEKRASPGTFSV